nr:hypothetical protein [Gammaproteobacteria bacterium]
MSRALENHGAPRKLIDEIARGSRRAGRYEMPGLDRNKSQSESAEAFLDMLKHRAGISTDGKTRLESRSRQVAQCPAETLFELGAEPAALFDSSRFVFDPTGIDREKRGWIKST